MENIGWWLHLTEQGMWKAQLQQAEETSGLGWLLFLADKFNWEAIKVYIWNMTGIQNLYLILSYQQCHKRTRQQFATKSESTPY